MTGDSTDEYPVAIVRDGVQSTLLLHVVEGTYPEVALTLTGRDRAWTATGTSVFAALLDLREQLEMQGIRLCCNGARRNAWSSGMQQDMARGRVVYLLQMNRSGRPAEVRTLDPAPCDQVVTVQEQKAWYAGWLAERAGRRD
jgi:hypothetical protein